MKKIPGTFEDAISKGWRCQLIRLETGSKEQIKKMNKIILFLCLISASLVTFADKQDYVNNLNTCYPNKNIIDNYEPLTFHLTNNLITNSDIHKPNNITPQIIILGKLLDKNCLPIPNANIYAWQVSPEGKYHYKPLRKSVVNKALFVDKDNSFIGNGLTTTDNEGNFAFITLLPQKGKISTSNGINIRAEHNKLGKVQTRFAFHKNSQELTQVHYLNYNGKSICDDNSVIYNLKLVMNSESGFKEH